jgi:hypothetical protein
MPLSTSNAFAESMATPAFTIRRPASNVPATKILFAGAIAGIAGDALMRGSMLRLGFALWIALLASVALVLGRSRPGASVNRAADRNAVAAHREQLLLLIGTVMAAMGLVWRDSEMLYAIDLLSVLCMGALTIWHGGGKRVAHLTVIESARAALMAITNSLLGAVGIMHHVQLERGGAEATAARARAIGVGILLAIPPIAIVVALLNASDVVFQGLVAYAASFVQLQGLQHLLVTVMLAWIASGWFRASLGLAISAPLSQLRSPAVPFMSVGVALNALVLVLLLFLATQLRVLFGGAQYLMATQGLTVATYARDGFFQLILASAVVLGTLVAAEWMLAADDTRGRTRFAITGAVLLALVLTLLASAATRMWLYVREFGLTTDRVFACALIGWVVLALYVFAGTMLRGRAYRFAPDMLMATIAWVVTLNLANPEAIVAHVNIARAQRGQSFDAAYHAKLSADALPELLKAADSMAAPDCQSLNTALVKAWSERLADPTDGGQDWRALNIGLWHTRRWFASGAAVCHSMGP